MDHDQDEVRGDGHPERIRHPLRPDPVDEGNRRGTVAARHRHGGGGRSSDPRQIPVGRQSDQDVGQHIRGETLSAAGRAHRGDPARRAGDLDQGAESLARLWPRGAVCGGIALMRLASSRAGEATFGVITAGS